MSRKMQGENDSERVTRDGTAARTRPLSIQDIMLRREKKAASEAKKTKEEHPENDKDSSNHLEKGRGCKSRKDPKDMVVEGSKKEKIRGTPTEGSKKEDPRHMPREDPKKEDMKYKPKDISKKDNSKDGRKVSSKMDNMKDTPKVPEKEDLRDVPKKRLKKDRSSIRDDDHLVGKDIGNCNSQKPSASMSGRADESKYGNPGDNRARNGDARRSEYQKGPGKRWKDETVDNDRIKDRSEKLQNETKRKGRSFDNEKSSEVGRLMLKKPDSAQFRDSKHSERNDGRIEYAKPYHGEPRPKRRRSRSRDYDRERHGRSISPPPREQRHSYRGHDFGHYPPYYSMEKSRRKHAETDKQRAPEDGGYSGGSYRTHESRLGGYSPRKRKTVEQAEKETTKAHSPVIQSPEKKSATWDQPPVSAAQSNFLTNLQPTIGQMTPSILGNFTALKHAQATTVEAILAGNSLAAESVQLTQATRPLRRLLIENLPGSATEDRLIDCLNDLLLSSGVKYTQRSKPCLSCTINKEKHQAFVEFLTPEDATAALLFDGRSLNGSVLKIRRPKEYIEMANVAPKKPAEKITLISDVVADSPHKIFIAGISEVISSEMLMEIVTAFGPLAAYHFLLNEELGGHCAFLEYKDHSITSKACAGLNGMKLGGCMLTAVHVYPNPPVEIGNEAYPFYGIPDHAKPLLEEPTKVLKLKGLFDREEYILLSKSELEETLEDVRLECARFGAVKSINVIEYPSGSENTADGNKVEPEDRSVKIELTEYGGDENSTGAGSECSVPQQSVDLPHHSDSTEIKDVYHITEGQDHKDKYLPSNAALCEGHAPAADQPTDPDDIQTRAAFPTLQHVEADHIISEAATDEDKHMEAAAGGTSVDDDPVGKGHGGPTTSGICSSATPGDEVEKSERAGEQQGADDVSEDRKEKLPTVATRDIAFVFEPGSVLVEFMRKEAACMAAHALHGRRFGNRAVSAGYAPHDLYLQKYPR
ncbi:hypothetical protein ACP70R_013057 [Stipagrostis hirtigluma subsp. patula]